MELVTTRRGDLHATCNTSRRIASTSTYRMPLGELIVDFYDQLKSRTQGYASLDYSFHDYEESDLVKLDILVNGMPVDALSMMLHRDKAQNQGRAARRAAAKN